MGLKKLATKVDDYNERLEHGKAHKIKASHVEKVLEKLRKKTISLRSEIASASNPDKKARLKRKLKIASEQVERAEWLLDEIT